MLDKIKHLNEQRALLNEIQLLLVNEFNMYQVNNILCDLEKINRFSSISDKDDFILKCDNRENKFEELEEYICEVLDFINEKTNKYELELLSQYVDKKDAPLLKHGIKYISEIYQDLIKKDANKIINEFSHLNNICYKILLDDTMQIYEFKNDNFNFITSYKVEHKKKYRILDTEELYIPF